MSLRRYLRPKDGLPDPMGPLSADLPSSTIGLANQMVAEVMKDSQEQGDHKKRGKYRK